MNKSTHQGHCQACGRLQMLPGGLLSKHGYTVAHGFFAGMCRGTAVLPFEKSCDLVKTFIEQAKKELASLENFQAKLRKPTTSNFGVWAYVYVADPRGRQYMSSRKWVTVNVREEVTKYDGGQYSKFFRTGDTKWQPGVDGVWAIQPRLTEVSADFNAKLATVCDKMNAQYAQWLEHDADSLRRYIKWQTERVRTWVEADLLAVGVKDKEGFKVTVAPW